MYLVGQATPLSIFLMPPPCPSTLADDDFDTIFGEVDEAKKSKLAISPPKIKVATKRKPEAEVQDEEGEIEELEPAQRQIGGNDDQVDFEIGSIQISPKAVRTPQKPIGTLDTLVVLYFVEIMINFTGLDHSCESLRAASSKPRLSDLDLTMVGYSEQEATEAIC